ncbi:amino acid/polyamine transporter I [Usnea florida]
MAEFDQHSTSFEKTKDRADVELHVLSEEDVIESKYMGTDSDRHDMIVLGRKQVLRRNFQFLSTVGFAAVLISTWEILFANLLFSLTDGGTAGLFWGYTVVVIASIFIYLSIGEMASMSPTAGGQYHWVSEFSPPWCQKYLSYISGWILAMGWQGSVVGLSFAAGTLIEGLITLNNSNYKPQQWHGTLLVIAVVVFAIVFNTSMAKQLPMVEIVILVIHILGLFAIIIPLLAMAPSRNSGQVALLDFYNGGGWSTRGLATMIGLLTPLGSMLGFDCAVHMSEEIRDASDTLPRSIFWGVILNVILGYIAVFTLCFIITDPSAILSTTTGYPFIQLCYNTTNSYAGTDVMVAIVVVALVCAVIAEIATASRQIWSFARDGGLPFSPFLSKVSPSFPIPLNAVIVSFLFGIVISLINLGSSVALNAIVSLTLSALLASYILSIGCILSKRLRREPLPPARWSLGRAGMAINIIALIFLLPCFVFCFFPTATPVVAKTMNWNIVMFGGISLWATGYYVVKGRKTYIPPVRIVKRDL